MTAQVLRSLGSFNGDVQKTSYAGLLKNLLYYKTGNLFKKPISIVIANSEVVLQFLNDLNTQLEYFKIGLTRF